MTDHPSEEVTTTWQYCIVRDRREGEVFYTVREVYFEHGQPSSWTADGVDPFGSTREEIFRCLADMMGATVRMKVLDLTGEKPEFILIAEADRRDREPLPRPRIRNGESR
jgi:hypothetical protein